MVNNKIIMKFIATTSEKLDKIGFKSGQLIFTTDDRAIYLDVDGKRVSYADIMTIVDEETRQSLTAPIEGFYYVRKENALWNYYHGLWTQMTGQKSNLVFSDSGLPIQGETEVLYVEDTALYRWNNLTNSYEHVGGAAWEDVAD